jgi:hypothetical protein
VAVGGGRLSGAARERSNLLRAPARERWPLSAAVANRKSIYRQHG